ncbi:MAG: hypothetical protein KAJ00_06870 [Deltaproteobacteria bacterium]|nr:hypothetical protein [Deltaproteobacteria bacterium]
MQKLLTSFLTGQAKGREEKRSEPHLNYLNIEQGILNDEVNGRKMRSGEGARRVISLQLRVDSQQSTARVKDSNENEL